MHILLALVGVLGAGAFWWYRVKHIGQAASEAVDVAERARGAWKRRQFRSKVDAATIDAIADPRTAAAVLLVALAGAEDGMNEAQEAMIREALRDAMAVDDPDDELTFAKWAAKDVIDPNNLTLRLSKLWTARLDRNERRAFADLARRVVEAGGGVSDTQRESLRRLEQRLAL